MILDVVPTSAPSEKEYGILQSEAVTSDYNIVDARDWRLHTSWLALNNRSRADAMKLLTEAASEAEWRTQPLRIPDLRCK